MTLLVKYGISTPRIQVLKNKETKWRKEKESEDELMTKPSTQSVHVGMLSVCVHVQSP